ncbi:MAG: hypothetical protein NTX09_07920 [Verrucomicrobia bacterium]|nr:hypothetical protein [Verrucomicrobiota bacterium]
MAAKSLPPPLLYADTTRSPDALYFGRVEVPDPFIAFGLRGKKYAVVGALEFGRVKKTSSFDVVLPLESYVKRARDLWPERKPGRKRASRFPKISPPGFTKNSSNSASTSKSPTARSSPHAKSKPPLKPPPFAKAIVSAPSASRPQKTFSAPARSPAGNCCTEGNG